MLLSHSLKLKNYGIFLEAFLGLYSFVFLNVKTKFAVFVVKVSKMVTSTLTT